MKVFLITVAWIIGCALLLTLTAKFPSLPKRWDVQMNETNENAGTPERLNDNE